MSPGFIVTHILFQQRNIAQHHLIWYIKPDVQDDLAGAGRATIREHRVSLSFSKVGLGYEGLGFRVFRVSGQETSQSNDGFQSCEHTAWLAILG